MNKTQSRWQMDQVYTYQDHEVHYHLHLPDDYQSSNRYPLYITLPGWEGLYFQGVGANLEAEHFGDYAIEHHPDMIVVAPQLNDWGETSADETIALTRYLLDQYAIDADRVYLQGYSAGGETGSLVIGKAPELYAKFLSVSSQWDGDIDVLVQSQTPVYLVTGEHDSYYGSSDLKKAYARIAAAYQNKHLCKKEINDLVVLELKDDDYFTNSDIHAGGLEIAEDAAIMEWLLS